MENMTLQNIAMACNGKLMGDVNQRLVVSGVTIDSRKVKPGHLFIAIKGERVDGHDFIRDACGKGAYCCVLEKIPEEGQYPYILVESTLQALKDLAVFYRQSLSVKVVGITGSVGKTSTKEMVASVLSEKYTVLKTEGNFNNEIGLPLTIFNIRKEHEVAVLEMGISDFGEMRRLSKIARPDICLITNIGWSHLENLKSREGILRAKSEMFDFMRPDGRICLNGDDDMLMSVKEVDGKIPLFFGFHKTNDIYADHIQNHGLEGISCTIYIKEEAFSVAIPVPGEHMVYNALAAAAIGSIMGLYKEEIKKGIESIKTVRGRNHIINMENIKIIDDSYNANPVSMKAALDVLRNADGRRVAVLGDMLELGENSRLLHEDIGRYAAAGNIECILCAGGNSKYMYEAAIGERSESKILYYKNREALIAALPELIKEKDTVLIKASHGMGFEKVVDAICKKQ